MNITDLPSLSLLKHRLSLLRQAAVTLDEKQEIDRQEKSLLELCDIPARFNQLFSVRGWIIYDSLNLSVARHILSIAKSKGIQQAELYLIGYYDSTVLEAGIARLWRIQQFRPRLRLIKLAYEDFISGRYHACIPVLLMMIDGVVADAGNNLGFFSENSKTTAYDSIAGHITGLQALKAIFYKPRGKTEKGKIALPYRNGILHGRDLGYANREVAAKCWALLFAISDQLAAQRDEVDAKKKYEEEKEKSIEDIRQDMQALNDSLMEVIQKDRYRRQSPVIGVDIPVTGSKDAYPVNSPEKALVEFFDFWKAHQYGPMAGCIAPSGGLTATKMAGKLNKIFSGKELCSFALIDCQDISSSICEIITTVDIAFNGNNMSNYRLSFRLLYYNKNLVDLVVDPQKEGGWKVVDNFGSINEIGRLLELLTDEDIS